MHGDLLALGPLRPEDCATDPLPRPPPASKPQGWRLLRLRLGTWGCPAAACLLLSATLLLALSLRLQWVHEEAEREEWSPAAWGQPWAAGQHGPSPARSWHELSQHGKRLMRQAYERSSAEGGGGNSTAASWVPVSGSPAGPYDARALPSLSSGGGSSSDVERSEPLPQRLKYPVLWAGPFFTRSGALTHPRGVAEQDSRTSLPRPAPPRPQGMARRPSALWLRCSSPAWSRGKTCERPGHT